MAIDSKNRAMLEGWSIPERDRQQISSWVQDTSKNILWKEYLFWKGKLNLDSTANTIEVGCGYGKFTMLLGLSEHHCTLFDYNPGTLNAALHAHRTIGLSPKGVTGDLLKPAPDLEGKFDVCCSFGLLEHFSGKHRLHALQAKSRMLREGGLLFFSVPSRHGVFYRIAFGLRKRLGLVLPSHYENPYSKKELTKLAELSGIDLLNLGCIGTLKQDFIYWIGENAKSFYRPLRRSEKLKRSPAIDETNLKNIDLSGRIRDQRNCLDKRFSYNLLFVGKKTIPNSN